MIKEQLYVATMAKDFEDTMAEGIGVEIDHFCTAYNMDEPSYSFVHEDVESILMKAPRAILHAPFNELHPAAIDPQALELAYRRLEQVYMLTQKYGIHHLVVHSGYLPFVYFKEWHTERSVKFWSCFMEDKPGDFHIYIENVLEDEPYMMEKLLWQLKNKNIHGCLDTGHANCMSSIPLEEWANVLAPYMGHVHLHNNHGSSDLHGAPEQGTADLAKTVEILHNKKDAIGRPITFTLECIPSMEGYNWLLEKGFL